MRKNGVLESYYFNDNFQAVAEIPSPLVLRLFSITPGRALVLPAAVFAKIHAQSNVSMNCSKEVSTAGFELTHRYFCRYKYKCMLPKATHR